MRRRPRRGGAELGLDRRLPLGEARAVEESVLVEARDDALDLLRGHRATVLAQHRRLHVDQRVLAVEERDDLEEWSRQQHDGFRESRGIAQRDYALALVLDG